LFEKGADINAVNNSGMSILHFSLVSEKFDIAEYLINNGADVSHADRSGRTALFWAALRGNSEIVKSLLDKGADAAVSDNGGTTPLHPAVEYGHFEIVKSLVEKGADVNAHNRSNDTILDVAVTYEKTDIADYIRVRGGVSTQLKEPLVKAVSGNYYRISFPYSLRTNTGISAGRDGILLIDPGEKRTVQKLKEETRKINDGAFRFLVNTHPHGDHTSGNNIADERTVLINFESLERLVSDKI
ncbi:MAG: MBL fold metallo-hydrolase, partial [bacterium]|nr:MBL fold metallo-hydrolase [bacterium]